MSSRTGDFWVRMLLFHASVKKNGVTRDITKIVLFLFRSVFVGADKKSGEIVALKRINTEQEENGFPITAIREVKLLKALKNQTL